MATKLENPMPRLGEHQLEPVTVTGNRMLPCYHHGDLLLVSQAASMRQGDRVVVRKNNGELLGGIFIGRSDESVTLTRGFKKNGEASISMNEINLLGRIIWASQ